MSHKASPDLKGGEINSIYWWEEVQSHVAKVWLQGKRHRTGGIFAINLLHQGWQPKWSLFIATFHFSRWGMKSMCMAWKCLSVSPQDLTCPWLPSCSDLGLREIGPWVYCYPHKCADASGPMGASGPPGLSDSPALSEGSTSFHVTCSCLRGPTPAKH